MKLIIAGGGTGGHFFPGVAVAEKLKATKATSEVLFVGTERGIEARLCPKLGWPIALISVSGIKTVGLLGAIKGLAKVPGALYQSYRLLKRQRPSVVLGVGGYASGPLVLMASLMGIPSAVLEQNSVPGMTNKILGRFVKRAFVSFGKSCEFFPKAKTALVGNPIRQTIAAAIQQSSSDDSSSGPCHVLVLGGSQGAVSVNTLCHAAFEELSTSGVPLKITHQTGSRDLENMQAKYDKLDLDVHVTAFIDDMAKAYQEADVIVSRAGATTIAELALVGKPALFIPYPYAAQNHQEENAKAMVESGAAMMFIESTVDKDTFVASLKSLITSKEKRRTMSSAMRSFAKPDAADQIIAWCLDQASTR